MRKPKTRTLKIVLERGVPTIIQSIDANEFYALQRKHTTKNFIGVSSLDTNGFMADMIFRCLISPEYETAEEMRKSILPGQYMDLMNAVSDINGFEIDKK